MRITVQEIALLLDAEIEGEPSREIHDIAKIEEGRPGTITFLANPKYLPYIYTTKASAVIVSREFQPEQALDSTLLRVPDPYSAFTRLLEFAQQKMQEKKGIEQPSFVSSTATLGEGVYVGAFAYIGERAKIGNNVKIYPQVYIGDNAEIGDDSILFPQVTVSHGCQVGKRCILNSGAVVGSEGFGFAPQEDGTLKKIPQTGIVRLEDDVEVGAHTAIDRATLGETLIRKGVKLDNLVQIAHNVDLGEHTVIAAQSGISGSTRLGKNCMLGGQVGVVGHLKLADGTKVGAQSGVSKNVKTPGKALRGSPAQDLNRQLRSEAVFRNLDEMSRRITNLERLLNHAKEDS